MDAMFTFSEEELNTSPKTSAMLTTTTENVGRSQIKRPSTLNITKTTELVLRDTTNADCQSESSPPNSVHKRQQKKKKRRTANSYSDISFNDKYTLTEEVLGTGAHGIVKTCRDRVTKQEYAVKIISKARHPDRTRVFKEIDIYYHCRSCNNILGIIDFLEDDDSFYLVFQKMEGGPLLNHIMKRGHLTERETSLIVRDIANGLNFLHSKGMSHRDLKPENILVERADSLTPIKLCDFDLGSAIRLNSNKTTPITTPELSTPVGSVEFMAPEVVDAWTSLEGSLQMYDKRCDLWSLGVIIYIMLCGYPPFYGSCGYSCGWTKGEECEECQSSLFERIQDGEFNFPEKDWKYISNGAKDLIKRLLVRDASARLTAAEVLKHPWIENNHELDNERPLNTPELLQQHDSIRRLESFTKDALSITKLIEERKRMVHYRSHSTDSINQRSRTSSHTDTDNDDDDDLNKSDINVNKRRVRKKKKQPQQQAKHNVNHTNNVTNMTNIKNKKVDEDVDDTQNFDAIRRRLSSATMTSGDEDITGDDDYLACSYKTVIHYPIQRFYMPPPENLTPPPSVPLVSSPLMSASSLTAIMPPSPLPLNMPMQHRARTEPDLFYYNQHGSISVFRPPSFYTTVAPSVLYGPPPPYMMHQGSFRSSSADCRRTVHYNHEPYAAYPERVW